VLFGTKFLKFGPKRANLATLVSALEAVKHSRQRRRAQLYFRFYAPPLTQKYSESGIDRRWKTHVPIKTSTTKGWATFGSRFRSNKDNETRRFLLVIYDNIYVTGKLQCTVRQVTLRLMSNCHHILQLSSTFCSLTLTT